MCCASLLETVTGKSAKAALLAQIQQIWPQHNDIWPAVNRATKYVASNTMTSHEWQPSVFLNGDIAEKITKIKQQHGPNLHDIFPIMA
jgi:hypothetical protein